MASDSVTERQASFEDGLAIVDPQIKGVQNKLNDNISAELKAALSDRLAVLQRRQSLIRSSIATQDAADAAVNALEDDGFPELPNMEISDSLIQELQAEGAADDAAAAGFEVIPPAANMSISLGSPIDKP